MSKEPKPVLPLELAEVLARELIRQETDPELSHPYVGAVIRDGDILGDPRSFGLDGEFDLVKLAAAVIAWRAKF